LTFKSSAPTERFPLGFGGGQGGHEYLVHRLLPRGQPTTRYSIARRANRRAAAAPGGRCSLAIDKVGKAASSVGFFNHVINRLTLHGSGGASSRGILAGRQASTSWQRIKRRSWTVIPAVAPQTDEKYRCRRT